MPRFDVVQLLVALLLGLLVVSGCSAGSEDGLEDVTWVLGTFIGADGEPNDVIADTRIDATFQGGQVSGSAGCNTYSGEFSVSDSTMDFGPVAVTEIWCEGPEGVMGQELDYLGMLARVTGFTIEGETLSLTDDADQVVAVFRAEE